MKDDYDKETFVNGYLGVSVLNGDKVTKDSTNNEKLHHSYEVRETFFHLSGSL
jgi:hypothetical protein